jgi:hypothetical protein
MGDFGERPSPIVPRVLSCWGLSIVPSLPAKVPLICLFSFSCCWMMSLKLLGELALTEGLWKIFFGLTVVLKLVVDASFVVGWLTAEFGFLLPGSKFKVLDVFLGSLLTLSFLRSENFFGD